MAGAFGGCCTAFDGALDKYSVAEIDECHDIVTLSSRAEFQIRDPFVLAENGTYYLYKTLVTTNGFGVGVATSKDLERWTDFAPVMVPAKGSRHTAVWAPEVHKYAGAYWLFTTLTFPADAKHPLVADYEKDFKGTEVYPRGVWIYRSELPTGPFRPVRDGSVTPADWMCLDGTLVVEDGKPWMVFCHEWCQVGNGRMMAAPLADDLSRFTAKPTELFRAACRPGFGYVTDGPFLLRDGGTLRMIWSNFVRDDYCVIQCRSQSGRLTGPWVDQKVLYPKDGGHGMLFRRFDGQLMLTLHQPNVGRKERMRLYRVELTADGIILKNQARLKTGG